LQEVIETTFTSFTSIFFITRSPSNGRFFTFNAPVFTFNALVFIFNAIVFTFNALVFIFNAIVFIFTSNLDDLGVISNISMLVSIFDDTYPLLLLISVFTFQSLFLILLELLLKFDV
jgi:hypothetical protein